MENNWVGFSPHIASKTNTNKLYLYLILSLLPAVVFSIISYGFLSLFLYVVTIASVIVFDCIFTLIKTKKLQFDDYSTIFIGILTAMTMPAGVPIYYPIIGAFVSTILIKRCAGGIGKNYVSEVAIAKVVTFLVFSGSIYGLYKCFGASTTTSVTLIDSLKQGLLPKDGIVKCIIGTQVGALGESAIICLLAGGIALCVLKVIDYKVPLIYLLSVFLFSVLFFGISFAPYYLLCGGAVFCAFYVATDFACCPDTLLGKILYALGGGLITVLLWKYSANYQMGAFYAVLICQVIVACVKGYYVPKYSGRR